MNKQRILIVDDIPANIDVLAGVFAQDYELSVAMNGREALDFIAGDDALPDLILLDVMMPEVDGFETCRRLKADPATSMIPIIFITARGEQDDEAHGLDLGAVDYITKPFQPKLVSARVRNHLELKRYRDNLEELVEERTRVLALTQEVTIQSMATLAEYRDPETGGHIKRTQTYVRFLAEKVRLMNYEDANYTVEDVKLLYRSAPLHDIGKVAVPDYILLKPGKLTPEEWVEMKKHPQYGRDTIAQQEKMLGANSFLHYARDIAYGHHEKWDGSGYPEGLSGADIPLPARMMAIADVYDALISKRVYKPPFPHAKAIEIIREGEGGHFDPTLARIMLDNHDEFRKIALEFADFQEERDVLSRA